MSAPDCLGTNEPADREAGYTACCPVCSAPVLATRSRRIPPHGPLVTEAGVHGPRCGEGEPLDPVTGERACTCSGVAA